jgi:hypothetical protein
MQNEPVPADAVVYRPPKSSFRLSVGVALLLGVAAVYPLAIFRAQGDVAAAYALSGFFVCMALANAAAAIHPLRHRLVVTPEIVRSVGVFATCEVRLADVRRVEWKSFHPAVVLHEDHRRLKIGLGEYGLRNRAALIERFRTALATRPQEGWEQFGSRWLPPSFDRTPSETRFRSGGVEYRMPAIALVVACIIAIASAFFGIIGVYDFLFPGRRIENPVALLAFFGTVSACALAGSGWLFRAYLRHRLLIASEFVRLTNSFSSKEVRLANVDRVVWRTVIGFNSVILHAGGVRLKISFGNYDASDLPEMIHLLHMAVASRGEEGWDEFEPRWSPPLPKMTRAVAERMLRFVLIAWGIALPIMYAAFVSLKLSEERSRISWLLVAIGPPAIAGGFIAMIWMMVRKALKESEKQLNAG